MPLVAIAQAALVLYVGRTPRRNVSIFFLASRLFTLLTTVPCASRYNHSNRVFYIGRALSASHFPFHVLDLESYYLACLFHDIGCSPKNLDLNVTKMSFEYYGGITAREWLLEKGAERDVADSVAEAIFRHTE